MSLTSRLHEDDIKKDATVSLFLIYYIFSLGKILSGYQLYTTAWNHRIFKSELFWVVIIERIFS